MHQCVIDDKCRLTYPNLYQIKQDMKFGNYQLDIVAKQVMINIPTVFVF